MSRAGRFVLALVVALVLSIAYTVFTVYGLLRNGLIPSRMLRTRALIRILAADLLFFAIAIVYGVLAA